MSVDTVVDLVSAGRTPDEILREYPYLEADDIPQALACAGWPPKEVQDSSEPSVKLLVAMNLPPSFVAHLRQHGFEAVHWSTVGAPTAHDGEILSWARANGFVLLTHTLDFPTILLTSTPETIPSTVQLRMQDLLSERAVKAVLTALRAHSEDLRQGALVSVDEGDARVGILPLRQS